MDVASGARHLHNSLWWCSRCRSSMSSRRTSTITHTKNFIRHQEMQSCYHGLADWFTFRSNIKGRRGRLPRSAIFVSNAWTSRRANAARRRKGNQIGGNLAVSVPKM